MLFEIVINAHDDDISSVFDDNWTKLHLFGSNPVSKFFGSIITKKLLKQPKNNIKMNQFESA